MPLASEVTFGLYIYRQLLVTGPRLAHYRGCGGEAQQEARDFMESKTVIET